MSVFAKCLGISRAAVYAAANRGKIDQLEPGMINLAGERTAAYLVGYGITGPDVALIAAGCMQRPEPRKNRLVTPAARLSPPPGPVAAASPIPAASLVTPITGGETAISDEQLFGQEASVLQKALAAEKIIDLRQARAVKRGELIKRNTVAGFFHSLIGIHRSELGSLGAKIAPELLSACGLTDERLLVQIERVIDENAYRMVSNIQRQTQDFLKGIDAEAEETLE